jgi:D-alanyl-D-alanine dipeptidase
MKLLQKVSFLLAGIFIGINPSRAQSPFSQKNLVDCSQVVPGLKIELKYSTDDNFLKKDVYGDLEKCYLHKDAAAMLKKAAEILHSMRPDLHFLAYDCVRPVSVQRLMWQAVKGTPAQNYLLNPDSKTGSIHNYGCAIDLTLADKAGKPLDMGTPFDFFGKAAGPRHEISLRKKNKLSAEQLGNRLLLRMVMVAAGFHPIPNEWWHFNCATPWQTRKRYSKVP